MSSSSSSDPPRIAINPPVFITSTGLLIAFLVFGSVFNKTAQAVLPQLLTFVSSTFGWLYVTAVVAFFAACLWFLFGKVGQLRLGPDDARPEFSTLAWFAMLFSAGMGIGLVFYGVAEPMMHYASPASGAGFTQAAASQALSTTFFHWGIHAWSIYALIGLAVAYFAYRKNMPLTLRSCLQPLLGRYTDGWPGHAVDISAVFGTLFGLATSLGLGALQVSAGLEKLFGYPSDLGGQLLLIAIITFAATMSLVTGVKKGIRRLSELNLALASLLALFVFLAGPTHFQLQAFVETLGRYGSEFLSRSFELGSPLSDQSSKWTRGWTLFYWGWWIAWSPFVGMFIARISRGRTVREFVLGVLFVPTLVTFAWFSIFGGTALQLQLSGQADIAAVVSSGDANQTATAIYVMLANLPQPTLTSFIAACVVAVFFVTSSDSASFVVDMLTSGGHPNPPVWQRVFWASSEGATAAVLLYAGGEKALTALQAGIVSIGLPFCLILLAIAWSLVRTMKRDIKTSSSAEGSAAAVPSQELPMDLSRILVPVDFSDASRRALDHALALVAASPGDEPPQVHVLHVAPRPVDYLPLDEWIYGESRSQKAVDEKLLAAAKEACADFVSDLPDEERKLVDTNVRLGVASVRIIEMLKEGAYSLAVLGTHGQSNPQRVILGSTVERVMRGAPCPVVTVR
jgi:choline/glycine/proline betaine transport protein